VAYDENSNDPVVLTWKDAERQNPSDKRNNGETSLNVLQSLLNFKNVNIQVGDAKQNEETKPANTSSALSLALSSPSKVWPSASIHSKTYDIKTVQKAFKLSEFKLEI
jgi:hypothetical protein